MAASKVEILLAAKDQASAVLDRITGSLKDMASQAKGLEGGAGVAFGAIVAGAAAAAGASVALAKGLAEQVESLGKVKAASGASRDNIQVLQRVFVNAGAAAADASAALVAMSRAIGRNDPILKQLGITSRDSFQALLQVSDVLGQMTDEGQKSLVMQRLLARASKEGAAAMVNLRASVSDTRAEYARFGALLTDEVTQGADGLDSSLDRMNTKLDAMRTALAIKVTPAVIQAVEQLNALLEILAKLSSLPVIHQVVQLSFKVFDFKETRDDIDEVAKRLRLVYVALTEGEEAAKKMAAAMGLVQAPKVGGGGASGGNGGGGDWKHPEADNAPPKPRAATPPAGPAPVPATTPTPPPWSPSLVPNTIKGWTPAPPKPAPALAKTKGLDTSNWVQVGVGDDGEPIFGPNLGGDKKASPREERLKSLTAAMGGAKVMAESLLAVLEKVEERRKQAAELTKAQEALFGTSADKEFANIPAATPRGPEFQGRVDQDAGEQGPQPKPRAPQMPKVDEKVPTKQLEKFRQQQKELLAGMPKLSEAMVEVSIRWGEVVQSTLSASAVLDQGFSALWNGLQTGLGTVFANLTNKAQTFRSAVKTIFSSLVQEVLAMLARLAAAKLFQLLLSLIPGVGTFLGTAAGAAAGAAGGAVTVSAGSTRGRTEGGSTSNTFIQVNALSAKDAIQSMVGPRGELRAAVGAARRRGY